MESALNWSKGQEEEPDSQRTSPGPIKFTQRGGMFEGGDDIRFELF